MAEFNQQNNLQSSKLKAGLPRVVVSRAVKFDSPHPDALTFLCYILIFASLCPIPVIGLRNPGYCIPFPETWGLKPLSCACLPLISSDLMSVPMTPINLNFWPA